MHVHFSRFLIIPPRILCPGGRASGFIFPWTLASTFCPIIHVPYAYVSYVGIIVFINSCFRCAEENFEVVRNLCRLSSDINADRPRIV